MKPLDSLRNPAIWSLLFIALGVVIDIVLVSTTHYPYTPGFFASNAVVAYGSAFWIHDDSTKRGIYFPADITLMWAWIGIPAYAYESRGMKGLFLATAIFAAYLAYAYLHLSLIDYLYFSRYR